MSLDEYKQVDGRPVAFDRSTVSFMEAHPSGYGVTVVIGEGCYQRELHIEGEFAALRAEFAETDIGRAFRQMEETRLRNEAEEDPAKRDLTDEVPF